MLIHHIDDGSVRPLVSIVTPSFNQAAFLEDTIRSVLAQDYTAIEYIIVDGGSTDGSVSLLERYAPQLSWWISEVDQGQAEAINKGLRHARGDILAWLNSDDLYLPGAVSEAVEVFRTNPNVGMIYGDALTIDPSGKPLKRFVFPDWRLEDLIAFRIICQPAVFFRRDILERVGYLDETYHLMLDHQLWVRIAVEAPIVHVSSVWAAARQHPAAKNVAQAERFGQEIFRILDWMESHPKTAPLIVRYRRKVLSGAHRLSARYLLDGGLPGKALRAYGRAMMHQPSYALKHWHRMSFAFVSLLGLGRLRYLYERLKKDQKPDLASLDDTVGWHGLNL